MEWNPQLTPKIAREMLKNGTSWWQKLTSKQIEFFTCVARGNEPIKREYRKRKVAEDESRLR